MSDDRDDDALLIPWAATGRLAPEERRRIEADTSRSPDLARNLAAAQEEQGETVWLNESLGVPSAAARDRLFARIDAQAGVFRPRMTMLDRLAQRLAALTPRHLAYAAAAAVALIVVQAGVLSAVLIGSSPQHASFTTASAPEAPAEAGQRLLIGFNPAASVQGITALLHDRHLKIVSGPRPGGLYELRSDRALSDPDLEAVIKNLRDNSGVVAFVASETGKPE